MKFLRFFANNLFFLVTLFLLVFIPLYPKLPLLDIKNTWVYIRVDDFVVALALLAWIVQLVRGKVSLKTPLTFPILVFWIFGAVATLHAILIIFPTLSNVFPNVAFLSFLRRVEYVSLFFVAFTSIKEKRFIHPVILTLVVTLLLVAAYGIGQRYLGFPAFLTMNEEYAKGVPIFLSGQSRVPSTFAGHYDLAAYLVLVLPIFASLLFGLKNWIVRIILTGSIGLGFVLMFMTVSRASFFVLLIALAIVLFFQKRKLFLFSVPAVILLFLVLSMSVTSNLFERFGSTVTPVDVLVDAESGEPIGHVKTIQIADYADKPVLRREFGERSDLFVVEDDPSLASSSSVVSPLKLPLEGIAVVPPDTPTGENLPQGTGYVNLTLSPVEKRLPVFFYDTSVLSDTPESEYVTMFVGNFLVKRAQAYDLSFTTRFQGEWPNAIDAFKRNILFGSGYSSISLAIDNNFLRILGEIGLLGFLSFFGIFLVAFVYIKKTLPAIESPVVRSFTLGFVAGVIGIFLNALLIDVFEASKIAYLLWILMGVTIGILHLYQTRPFLLVAELRKVLASPFAIFAYIVFLTFVMFWQVTNNYFLGDDFTWLRWAADCGFPNGSCPSLAARIGEYFTQADGFFYRPGTKLYFLAMYSFFWLNQQAYHIVSLLLHAVTVFLFFLLVRKIVRDNAFAAFSALLFLVLSGYAESVFWIAATGHLFNALLILLSVYLFALWSEKKRVVLYVLSLASFSLSLLFHELGVVVPFLILLYKFLSDKSFRLRHVFGRVEYILLIAPIFWYLIIRFFAHSHWFSGDYSYNILKLPLNIVGNAVGYLTLSVLGPITLPLYETIRTIMREQTLLLMAIILFGLGVLGLIVRKISFNRMRSFGEKIDDESRRVIIFGVFFFLIMLLPFLGFGNITSRYSYLASGGVVVLIVLVLKKLYTALQKSGREIALASLAVIIAVFSLFHVIQTQQMSGDWYEAGKRTERFITTIDAKYEDRWATQQIDFYFVNTPIRVGSAWMFPVGLEDALWFVFRNPALRVHQEQSLQDAVNNIEDPYTDHVFEFQEDGSIRSVKKSRTGAPVYDQ